MGHSEMESAPVQAGTVRAMSPPQQLSAEELLSLCFQDRLKGSWILELILDPPAPLCTVLQGSSRSAAWAGTTLANGEEHPWSQCSSSCTSAHPGLELLFSAGLS